MGLGMAAIRFLLQAASALLGVTHLGTVDGAEALYAFGDSFVDTGNGGYNGPPYGMTWPGYPAGRASDGRNQVDYFAELFGLPSPTPYLQMKNNKRIGGVNFGQGGAGVTYAFGYTPLDKQVDALEALVEGGVLSKSHLAKSVALVCLGVNDYNAYNWVAESKGMATTITTVVDGIALNVLRIHGLGIRHIIVANLALMACSPYITMASNYTVCSTSATLLNETSRHNALLDARVWLLTRELPNANIIVVDQTKAFEYLFHHGAKFGFEDALTPCCTGINESYVLNCGEVDSGGRPLYKLCNDVSKTVIFDGIHPTQAGWKAVINLYASVTGFTRKGPKLDTWIKMHDI